jgi:hypothetical protein
VFNYARPIAAIYSACAMVAWKKAKALLTRQHPTEHLQEHLQWGILSDVITSLLLAPFLLDGVASVSLSVCWLLVSMECCWFGWRFADVAFNQCKQLLPVCCRSLLGHNRALSLDSLVGFSLLLLWRWLTLAVYIFTV